MPRNGPGPSTGARTQSDAKTAQPPLYQVVMHNDDYTTMEFVVEVLETVFHRHPADATSIMLHVHYKGRGVCGTYPFEIAETKVARVHQMARKAGYPLRCSLEKT